MIIRLLILLQCFVFSLSGHASVCQDGHCIAMVDAGSTGSRLYVYSFSVDEKQNPINVKALWVKQITPGFASLESTQSVIDEYLTTLFFDAPETNLPVYFLATGGMRLLTTEQQQLRYGLLRHWFMSNPLWRLMDSKTISGREEGLYGWLAVNYLVGSLTHDNTPYVSVMDMGGASVQVAFPVSSTDGIDESDLVRLDNNGHPINLFVHSFLGLGLTQMLNELHNAAHCFPVEYSLPNGALAEGNAFTCQQDVSQQIQAIHQVDHYLAPLFPLNQASQWVATGGVSLLIKNKLLSFLEGHFTSEELLQQANTAFCQKLATDLTTAFPEDAYILKNCFASAYYYGLMVNGYGFVPNQPINFLPADEEPSWTLGVVLQQQSNAHRSSL